MKSVPCKPSPGIPNLEPTPNHDCHIARNTLDSSATDLNLLLRITQVRNLHSSVSGRTVRARREGRGGEIYLPSWIDFKCGLQFHKWSLKFQKYTHTPFLYLRMCFIRILNTGGGIWEYIFACWRSEKYKKSYLREENNTFFSISNSYKSIFKPQIGGKIRIPQRGLEKHFLPCNVLMASSNLLIISVTDAAGLVLFTYVYLLIFITWTWQNFQ